MELIKKASNRCCWIWWHIIGIAFISFGASLLIFFPEFFHNQLMKNLELKPDSRSYNDWKKPSVPLYLDIYFFNWTNPHELKNTSTKPTFQEIGPYRFREFPDKTNISFDDIEFTVSYRKFSTYFFDKEGSNGSLSDICTTVNMVALGAVNKAKDWNFFLQKGVSVALRTYKQEIHITKTVQELLFDGYEDDMVTMSTIFSNETPYDKIGFFVKRNGTAELSGNYSVTTGVDDISRLGQMVSYNNFTEYPYYEGECKKLKGSGGEFFPPKPSPDESIFLFTPDMCRAIPYDYEKSIDLHGVTGYRFTAGARALDNGTFYEENKCYASNEKLPWGLINITTCNYGFPLFMSYPHFYGSDKSYVFAVDGLSPVKNKHESYITLEPKTGITLEVLARFQSNLLIKQYSEHIPLYDKVPEIVMPIFWLEQKFVMDTDKTSQVKLALNAPIFGQIVGVLLIFLGVLVMSISHFRKCFCAKEQAKNFLSKLETNGHVTVIKDYETNPLMKRGYKTDTKIEVKN